MLDYHSHGKLLLSGEYFVLDGALALAVPTRLGQKMTVQVKEAVKPGLLWQSYDVEGQCWFDARFDLPALRIVETTDPEAASRLQSVFRAIGRQRPAFWPSAEWLEITTRLEFPRLWGLGTSSTLLVNLARWSKTDPFRLLRETFTGSGYDIACGLADQPILYQMAEEQPQHVQLPYRPPFAGQLYFVYLGAKQDSRAGIARYREKVREPERWTGQVSQLTLAMLQARTLGEFEGVIQQHEALVAEALELTPVRQAAFSDYWGQVKSLGAWGGDFVLATSDRSAANTQQYFNEKGYSVVLPYEELSI